LVYITKQVKFSAGHRLYNPEFSDEENDRIYDKCNNPRGHGHNYTLEVTLCGKPDPIIGYLYDLKKLKEIINREIVDKVDHKNLNEDVDFLKGVIPTVENLAIKFWELLERKFGDAKLYRIKLYETDTSFVEYYGEK
jgi:6-pyruvoyltetrahydropterin/6-carboxytetrahydropterin synthase